ncbi:dTMP kinase [bacterium]|nr:dTMP kinase [bacterium]
MPRQPKSKGLFFTFEGGEGSGKSTQARLLQTWLESQGVKTVLTREPGGTLIGGKIRELLLNHEAPISQRAELLLYEADRAHHVATKILPALARGEVVLCDRFADSSTVYQGICRGLGEKATQDLNAYATGGLVPHKVILIDMPAEEGIARVRARQGKLDKMEREAMVFHKKVRAGFLKLARRQPSRYVILDGRKPIAELEQIIRSVAQKELKRRGLWKP